MKKINPIDDYEEIARFKNNVGDMSSYDWGTNSSDIKKLREENRRMKIERYMVDGKKFSQKTN